jgi:uncharacterized protein YkwD
MRTMAAGFLVAGLFSFTLSFCPAQNNQAGQFKLSKTEQMVVDMTNAARKKENLEPLKAHPILTEVARAHCVNMSKQDKLEHILDEKTPFQRMKEAGYFYNYAGENIAIGFGNFPAPRIFQNWMDSKLHKDNILKREFTEIGVGVYIDNQGKTWYTQVFAKPRPTP